MSAPKARRSADAAGAAGRVTLRDLADHLGLSPASISLVLNRAPGARAIPPSTQERIRAAARRFHYRPNPIARSLRHQRSFTVGVMVPEISEGYAALVMGGIEDYLLQAGFLYFVASHRHRDDLIEEYPKLLLGRAVEGLIAVDTPCRSVPPLPTVTVSGHRQLAGVTNIILNHDRAAALAIEHLAALGHRRVAFIKGQAFSSDTDVRWRATVRAARHAGLQVDERLVGQLEGDQPTPEPGRRVTHALLAAGLPFSALFAFNDMSAIGAVQALRDAGLRVPHDVSVVGFDDIPAAAYQNPALTTVRQPLRRMGELAAATLLDRIERGGVGAAARRISVEPELVVRKTTAPAKSSARPGRSTSR
ncbi:MAG: LacI family transcriptional regulator [Vicinamibacteraceae bacterium]|nr:LacI family transcriptional regulator [Vicinamibacteraceae bacterium]